MICNSGCIKLLILSLVAIVFESCQFQSISTINEEDSEIVICFKNETDHQISAEVNDPDWYVSGFSVEPHSSWGYGFEMKEGQSPFFILSMREITLYLDNGQSFNFNKDDLYQTQDFSPTWPHNYHMTSYKATKNSVARIIYTFVITDETVEAWKTLM